MTTMLTGISVAILSVALAAAASAQEPVGCDKFKWPLDHERKLLARAAPVAAGAEVSNPLSGAVKLALSPFADAKLPMAPSRPPKAGESSAGFVRYAALPHAGRYRVTLSQSAWIDVVQDGHEAKSTAFTAALGCDGVRKSVKFDLTVAPFVVEISGAAAREIAITVTSD